jgi:hypothetical protein
MPRRPNAAVIAAGTTKLSSEIPGTIQGPCSGAPWRDCPTTDAPCCRAGAHAYLAEAPVTDCSKVLDRAAGAS